MAAKPIKFVITAITSKYKRQIQGLGAFSKRSFKKMRENANKAGKIIGIAFAAGVGLAIFKLRQLAVESVQLANVQEAVETRLRAVIKSTGEAAGFTADQMFNMASSLQKVTTVGDETIIAGQAILATFKKIRGEAFERATKAAIDMSEVMQTDLRSSIVMIGKAMNDPIANLSAMSRAGVQFSKDQKETIKTLIEMGRESEAQAIILKELESQFGGAAAAARDTYGGAMKSLKNAFGDFKEEIGFSTTKNGFFIKSIKVAEQVIIGFTKKLERNRDAIINIKTEKFIGAINFLIDGLKAFANAWLGLKLIANGVIAGIAKAVRLMLKPVELSLKAIGALGEKIEAIAKARGIKIPGIEGVKGLSDVLLGLQKPFEDFEKSSVEALKKVVKETEELNNQFENVKQKAKEITEAIASGVDPTKIAEIITGEKGDPEIETARTKKDELIKIEAETQKGMLFWKEWAVQENSQLNDLIKQNEDDTFKTVQQLRVQDVKNRRNFVGNIATILNTAGEHNKKAFRAAKAVSLAGAIVNVAAGAAQALDLPYPYNLFALASVLAAGLPQIAAIKSAEPGSATAPSSSGSSGGSASIPSTSGGGLTDIPTFPDQQEIDARPNVSIIVEGDFLNDVEALERVAEKISELVESNNVRLVASNAITADAVT